MRARPAAPDPSEPAASRGAEPVTVRVDLGGRGYDIVIGRGVAAEAGARTYGTTLGALLDGIAAPSRAVAVSGLALSLLPVSAADASGGQAGVVLRAAAGAPRWCRAARRCSTRTW